MLKKLDIDDNYHSPSQHW